MGRSFHTKIAGIALVAVLGMLYLNQISGVIPDKDYNENKAKAEKPTFDIKRLEPFPQAFDNYLNDNFSLRGWFLSLHTFLNLKVFRTHVNIDKVLQGKEGRLFNADKEIATYTGKRVFSEAELVKFKQVMQQRKTALEAKGVKMYVAIAPTNFTVNSACLPWFIQRKSDSILTLKKQAMGALQELGIPVTDVADVFENKSADTTYYFKHDNHWNDIGGSLGSAYLLNTIRKDFPQIPKYGIRDFKIDTVQKQGGNLAEAIASSDAFVEEDYKLIPQFTPHATATENGKYPIPDWHLYKWEYQHSFERPNSDTLPAVLVIRDSFGYGTMSFFPHHFRRCTYIFDQWKYMDNMPIVEQEKPDIVVYFILESLLPEVVYNN